MLVLAAVGGRADLDAFDQQLEFARRELDRAAGLARAEGALIAEAARTQALGQYPRCDQILAEVDAAVATWRSVGAALGMTSSELETFAEAFEHDQRSDR